MTHYNITDKSGYSLYDSRYDDQGPEYDSSLDPPYHSVDYVHGETGEVKTACRKEIVKPDGTSGKQIWQRPPGPLDGYKPHVYLPCGLEALPEAGEQWLWWAEGEKAATAIQYAGHLALSTIGGAGSVGKADWRLVSGHKVMIWGDSDEKGAEAVPLAALRAYQAGAAEVRLVDTLDGRYNEYLDRDKKGADAADLPREVLQSELRRLPGSALALSQADVTWLEVQTGDGECSSAHPQSYPWHAEGEFVTPWECSPDADIARTMRRHAHALLIVCPNDGSPAYLRAATEGGVWARADDAIDQLIADTAREWGHAAMDDVNLDKQATSRITGHAKTLSRHKGRLTAQESVGRVYRQWKKDGVLPDALTVCQESELNADRRYIGAPNGVIDLDTGRLLTGDEARAKLVSRRVPDPYAADAKHPVIDRLLAHLDETAQGYILSALGYAIRRGPGRRIYVLEGKLKSGKSTLLSAITSALGDTKGERGYGMGVQAEALLSNRHANPNGHQGGLFGMHDALIATVSELPDRTARFNTGLLKSLDGIAALPLRDVHEKAGAARPVRATLIVAINETDLTKVNLADPALADRVKILDYPPLPQGHADTSVIETVTKDSSARQAMLALLVRAASAYAADGCEPPQDIPSVAAAVKARRAESLGPVGQWLKEHILVTGDPAHHIITNDLFDKLAESFPQDGFFCPTPRDGGIRNYAFCEEREESV